MSHPAADSMATLVSCPRPFLPSRWRAARRGCRVEYGRTRWLTQCLTPWRRSQQGALKARHKGMPKPDL